MEQKKKGLYRILWWSIIIGIVVWILIATILKLSIYELGAPFVLSFLLFSIYKLITMDYEDGKFTMHEWQARFGFILFVSCPTILIGLYCAVLFNRKLFEYILFDTGTGSAIIFYCMVVGALGILINITALEPE